MNRKNLLYFLTAALTLQFFVTSCTNNPENKGETKSQADKTAVTSQPAAVQTTPAKDSKDSAKTAPQKAPENSAPADPATAAKLTDTAKLLAGLKVAPDSTLAAVEKTGAWNAHASYFETAWKKLDNQQLSKIKEWSKTEIPNLNQSSGPIFYPFSGPDFLYASLFFPNGSDYVMAGLEPVGEIPQLQNISDSQLDRRLQGVSSSMYAILQFSFFRTNDMKVDLAEKGVLPILMVFLARTNHEISNIQYVGVKKDGTLEVFENAQKAREAKNAVPGVKITFKPAGESKTQNLYYFSLDLSNEGLQKTPEFPEFVKQFPQPTTYLKAASYLMHNDSFSKIRDFILAQSSHVLQDDSGMPVKYFDQNKWDVKLYGNYTQPIDLFSNRGQADLRQMYRDNAKKIKPLDFGIGYKFLVNESNMMLATSKEKGAAKP